MCCGIISGQDSLFAITYRAKTPFKDGIFNGNIGGIAIGNATHGGGPMLNLYLPGFQLLFPPTLAGYKQTLCTQTTCPQERGEIYTLYIGFRFVTKILCSLVRTKILIVGSTETHQFKNKNYIDFRA